MLNRVQMGNERKPVWTQSGNPCDCSSSGLNLVRWLYWPNSPTKNAQKKKCYPHGFRTMHHKNYHHSCGEYTIIYHWLNSTKISPKKSLCPSLPPNTKKHALNQKTGPQGPIPPFPAANRTSSSESSKRFASAACSLAIAGPNVSTMPHERRAMATENNGAFSGLTKRVQRFVEETCFFSDRFFVWRSLVIGS